MQSTSHSALIIENNPVIALDLTESFAASGYTCIGTPDSEEGAALFLVNHRPEIAIVDTNIGIAATNQIVRTLQSLRVPYICITGCERCDLPATNETVAVLEKPFNSSTLVS